MAVADWEQFKGLGAILPRAEMLIRCRLYVVLVCRAFVRPTAAQASWAITHVNVVDVRDGHIQRYRTMIISNGKISQILSSREKVPARAAAVDESGKFVIPGLWDKCVVAVCKNSLRPN
jgi:cytosine/adenosine deaminase-related metal-dependent hydrolase